MDEVNEMWQKIKNLRREAENELAKLIRLLSRIQRALHNRSHMYTKQDVLREAKKMFEEFTEKMNTYQTFQNQANQGVGGSFYTEAQNQANEIIQPLNLLEVKENSSDIEHATENVVSADVGYEYPTLTKFCSDEQILKVDVKNWLLKEGYILDNKTVTDKGKEIGIKEVVTAEHNNKRLVFDEKAQGFLKDHYKDIEKLSGRSVKKEVSRSKDINNADNYLKGVKAIVNNQKGGNQPKDITM